MNEDELVNDFTIFKYLPPKDNCILSNLKGYDLQELFALENKYQLELRDSINLDCDNTFGLEIEFEGINTVTTRLLLERYFSELWPVRCDSSLERGAEINSPILVDNKANWQMLKKICNAVLKKANSINTNISFKNAGGHVHIGSQILGSDKKNWFNFFKLWATYENIIYRFSYGEFLNPRPKIFQYAASMADELKNDYKYFKKPSIPLSEVLFQIGDMKNNAVNFGHVHLISAVKKEGNTIEFRCPNGTLDPVIWQNNVNLFSKLLLYAKSTKFNDDIIDTRYKHNKKNYQIYSYNQIYLEQALELCDMIFDNNLDKIYFLRQYLKSFETTLRIDKLIKCRKFTKK